MVLWYNLCIKYAVKVRIIMMGVKGQKAHNFNDLTGQTFGLLYVESRADNNKNGQARWNCVCSCVDKGRTVTTTDKLKSGHTTSCGCWQRSHNKTHGMHKDRLYKIWQDIKNRCYNPKHESYKNYGGRGIQACKCVTVGFEPFRDWAVATGYTDEMTIERKDVNGDYCICNNNLKWIPFYKQAWNRRVKKDSKSGVSGVSLYRTTGKWQSRISVRGKAIWLGVYDDIKDAINARREAEKKYWNKTAETQRDQIHIDDMAVNT